KGAEGIRFYHQSAEEIHFRGKFDVAVGRFALEYSDVNRSLAALKSVLRSKAELAFQIHHPASITTSGSRVWVSTFGELLELGVFDMLRQHLLNPVESEASRIESLLEPIRTRLSKRFLSSNQLDIWTLMARPQQEEFLETLASLAGSGTPSD